MFYCLSSFLSPALAAKPLQLVRPGRKERGRKEHRETVESGDTGGQKRLWLHDVTFGKATALRSAPSKDRQIAGVYTAIPQEGKGWSRD
ncbi:hypothetical protein AU467_18185 [Mesorhizobium loti]|uniref:Uncharacterized protein n=1 Tax=Rhizobium loti TaxID=381 RepID=A0A101KUH7_RHILI|nr:hypothetical protein AU467_18185 [Mesorhizobium loti]